MNETRTEFEALFVGELVALLAAVRSLAPEWCRRKSLELHDVQFMLCEWDK